MNLTAISFPGTIKTLANGLTIIHQKIDTAPIVTVDVWVKAGARSEPEEWSGIAHFLEHMIFKGSDRLPPGYFDQVIENHGGSTNAATSHDYAHFYINVATAQLPYALECFAEILLQATIPDDEFIRERDVVLEELRQSQDDPDWVGFQALMESVYPSHSYGRPVIGTEDSILRQSPQQMRQFHRHCYQPQNMTIVVVGDISAQDAIAQVEATFSNFLPPPLPLPTTLLSPNSITLTQPGIYRQELGLSRIEQARLTMAWTGPGVEQLHDAYGLDILAVAIAGSRTSHLVQELREERQLVQAIASDFSLQQDSSLITISAWLEPEHLADVEAIITERLQQFSSDPMSIEELRRFKRLLCNDYAFSTETGSQIAGLYGYYSILASAELAVHYPHYIQSFQPYQLQHLAQTYLPPDSYAITILKPLDI